MVQCVLVVQGNHLSDELLLEATLNQRLIDFEFHATDFLSLNDSNGIQEMLHDRLTFLGSEKRLLVLDA